MKKLLVVLAVLALACSAHANLLVNGDFETPPLGAPIPGWTNVGLGPGFFPFSSNSPVPMTGANAWHGILGPGTPDAGFIYQQVGVSVGSLLDVFVEVASYSGGGEDDSWHHLGLGIDPTGGTDYLAASVVKMEIMNKAARPGVDDLSLSGVTAQSDTVTVFLYSKMDDDNGAWWAHAFDNASLTVVPEPGSLLALGTGLIGLFGVLRRRR